MDELKNELLEYLPRLLDGLEDMSRKFQMGQVENALSMLSDTTEGIDWVCQAFNALLPEKSIYINGINAQLYEINNSLNNKDFVMVADLFEYEINPLLKKMNEAIMQRIIN